MIYGKNNPEEALRQVYKTHFGVEARSITSIQGDGSDRRIYRLRGETGTVVGVWGDNLQVNRAFLAFTKVFSHHGLSVPELYAVSLDGNSYLLQDLGEVSFSHWLHMQKQDEGLSREAIRMYETVLHELVRFQIDASPSIEGAYFCKFSSFGLDAMRFDVRYFREMFLNQLCSLPIDDVAYERDAETLIRQLLTAERQYFLYRDFQSRNVMILDGAPYFIDYQSGMWGALQYDVASLLYDSTGMLTDSERTHLLDSYLDEVSKRITVDRKNFLHLFNGFAIIRMMQALGAFGNLGVRKGKTWFLTYIPSRLAALAKIVSTSDILESAPYLRDLLLQIASDPTLIRVL